MSYQVSAISSSCETDRSVQKSRASPVLSNTASVTGIEVSESSPLSMPWTGVCSQRAVAMLSA
jgi:hypothetical protein